MKFACIPISRYESFNGFNMYWKLSVIICFTLCSNSPNAQRRITNGHKVVGEKRYMVYLLQAPPLKFSGWTCGGAIISINHVLTSSSCVRAVPHAYVISGYRKYVPARAMEQDECIMKTRRKIINYCHPNRFQRDRTFDGRPDFWSFGDICIAKVDIPFDIGDKSYYDICSYPPGTIGVNYHPELLRETTEVITLGWGHTQYYRPAGVIKDLNEQYLHYSSGIISGNKRCVELHKDFFGREDLKYADPMHQFWICVTEAGKMDENGEFINYNTDYYNYCNNTFNPVYGRQNTDNESAVDCYGGDSLRSKDTYNASSNRVGGFCQNDHGGPLIGWIGGRETVLGVATIFAVANDLQCRTPYLYSSTVAINKLLACFLWTNFTRFYNKFESRIRRFVNKQKLLHST